MDILLLTLYSLLFSTCVVNFYHLLKVSYFHCILSLASAVVMIEPIISVMVKLYYAN